VRKLLGIIVVIAIGAALVIPILLKSGMTEKSTESILETGVENLRITVVYDNYQYQQGLTPDWGFSCLIEGCEKTILFDTGDNGSILLENMDKLGVNYEDIDIIVISHNHGDHTGGLFRVLERTHNVTVYISGFYSDTFTFAAKEKGAEVVEVSDSIEICKNVYSTGALGGGIIEQSLIIETEKGLIIITGCAHPGVVHIVETSKELVSGDVLLVMGGFHLRDKDSSYLESIISQFKDLGVIYAGPCHCSGDLTRELFGREYDEYYIEIGVGRVITLDDLQ
jgi:7,8-dihydropterin-6-yl-methyl-4-(beta-D-ribofuranosyl)aminobenzene 5'-phosphate synthase